MVAVHCRQHARYLSDMSAGWDSLHCLAICAPLLRAWCSRLSALLATQVHFLMLPDELLCTILQRAWADRPVHDAAEEVRCAAGLALV